MAVFRRCSRSSLCSSNSVWVPLVFGVRHALYPSWHFDPIADKEELAKLEAEGKLEALKVIPVKPAPNDLTTSVYEDPVVKKFTNLVMMWGDKAVANKQMHQTFAKIKRIQLAKYHSATDEEKLIIVLNPKEILYRAVDNCKPVLSLMPIKKGGITYQVPFPITANRSRFMSMKWLVMAARDKDGKTTTFVDQLAKELLDAFHYEGRVIKRKLDLHKICENNKAYAHYRWS